MVDNSTIEGMTLHSILVDLYCVDFAFKGFFQPLEGTPPSYIFSDHDTNDDIFFYTDFQDNLFITDLKYRLRATGNRCSSEGILNL